jgi:hypothetical protein
VSKLRRRRQLSELLLLGWLLLLCKLLLPVLDKLLLLLSKLQLLLTLLLMGKLLLLLLHLLDKRRPTEAHPRTPHREARASLVLLCLARSDGARAQPTAQVDSDKLRLSHAEALRLHHRLRLFRLHSGHSDGALCRQRRMPPAPGTIRAGTSQAVPAVTSARLLCTYTVLAPASPDGRRPALRFLGVRMTQSSLWFHDRFGDHDWSVAKICSKKDYQDGLIFQKHLSIPLQD